MDFAALTDKFSRLGRPTIVLVGDFMLDEYVYGDVERINPEAPVPVLRAVRTEQRLGGAGRVAADLAELGAEVICVGMIGEDATGRLLLDQLTTLGCDVRWMHRQSTRPTTRKTRLIGLAQHRHPHQLLRVDHEETEPADALAQLQTDGDLLACVDRADALLLQDYNKGFLTPKAIGPLIAAAKERNVPVLVDPALVADYSRYRGATLITPNRYEASLAADEQVAPLVIGPDGQADLSQLARVAARLIQRAELEHVVITLDREGVYLASRAGTGQWIPTRPRTIYDVSGAGDMVLAVLGLCWNQADLSAGESVALANMAGGLEVEKFGSVPISRSELLAEIHAQVRGRSKLWDLNLLVSETGRLRAAGKRIAFTNGCFDILHPGHVEYLQFARDQGDVLVLGLNSDASVRRNKGPGRPICNELERAAVLSGLACIDYIVLFDADTPYELIKAVQPDALIKGADWAGNVVGSDLVEARGGKVILADLVAGKSTTDVIKRILEQKKD